MMRLLVALLILPVALLLIGGPAVAYAQPEAGAPTGAEPPAIAPKPPYERHMDNGVKLYEEENWAAAITEFQAAYDAHPKASPLINQALCYKKLRQYPMAIEVLEKALREHSDTLAEPHRIAAENEVAELRALIALVTVRLSPAEARLLVDGREVTLPTADAPLPLAPGPHELRAEAPGYAPAVSKITAVSGAANPPAVLTLVPVTGTVDVRAAAPDSWIEVDRMQVGQGRYQGRLAPGVHAVRVHRAGKAFAIQIVVAAGRDALVTQQPDGTLASAARAPEDEPPVAPVRKLPFPAALEGFYGMASAGILSVVGNVTGFKRSDAVEAGFVIGGHLGYHVADWAAFELFGQYSDIRIGGSYDHGTGDKQQFSLIGGRVGGALRVRLPARTLVRFCGMAGGGAVIEELGFLNAPTPPAGQAEAYDPMFGAGFAAEVDLGVELELSRIIFGLVMQNTVQSTKHLSHESGVNAFDEKPLFIIGPKLQLGYAFW